MATSEEPVRYIEPKRFPKKLLTSGERVVVETRPHWSTWGWYEFFKLVLYAVVVAATYEGVPALFDRFWHINSEVDRVLEFITQGRVWTLIYFCAWGIFVLQKLNQWRLLHSTVYVATDERVIKYRYSPKSRRKIQDVPLTSIREVKETQSVKHILLGYGTLIFSKEDGILAMEWAAVPKPLEILRRIPATFVQQTGSRKR